MLEENTVNQSMPNCQDGWIWKLNVPDAGGKLHDNNALRNKKVSNAVPLPVRRMVKIPMQLFSMKS